MDFEFLKPYERLRVMDFLQQVGIDVSDWGNYKRGKEHAASNPKYCYEWTFQDHEKKLIILNLWYDNLEMRGSSIIQKLNMRATAEDVTSSPQRRRAYDMDFALQKAARLNWPLRVIICDGTQRIDTPEQKRSKTETRMLDEEFWTLESYDGASGDCILVRGFAAEKYVDQFDEFTSISAPVSKTESIARKYSRSPYVRKQVLERARGRCEFCGTVGFKTLSGSIYLETHHIVPLSESGDDSTTNVVALCPNHHRQAHYGEDSASFREKLRTRISELNKPKQPTAMSAGL